MDNILTPTMPNLKFDESRLLTENDLQNIDSYQKARMLIDNEKFCADIIEYYMDSQNHFQSCVNHFFEIYNHVGRCYENIDGKDISISVFRSEIYIQYEEKLKDEEGYRLQAPERAFKKLFTKGYTKEKLFALVFGTWFGLSDKQISQIENKRDQKSAWNLLDFFLRYLDRQNADFHKNNPSRYMQKTRYFIETESYAIPATFSDGSLISKSGTRRFTIL